MPREMFIRSDGTMSKKALILLLFNALFSVNGIAQLGSFVNMSDLIGSSASEYLLSHGITQPVLGVVLYLISTVFLYGLLEHYHKAKPSVPSDPAVPKRVSRVVAFADRMEKKYGANWVDKFESIGRALDTVGSKKK